MRRVELEGFGALVIPEPAEVDGLFAGEVKTIEGVEVLEPRLFATSGFEYARARRILSTDRVLFALGVIAWAVPFKMWCPLQLYWPEGKPDVSRASVIPRSGSFPLQIYTGLFHCFDCGIDAEAFAIRGEAYLVKRDFPTGPEVAALLKRCPDCGGDMKNPGLVEIHHVMRPPPSL
jgi:hypothetical protein